MADTDLTGLSEINALLGAGTEYEGKLVFQGRVRVDGRFVGEILGSDVLILGATADVHAHVEVGSLIVLGGALHGDVVARRVVELHAPGAVHGDIQTPQLFIDKGATFTGQCRMGEGSTEVHELTPEPRVGGLGGKVLASADAQPLRQPPLAAGPTDALHEGDGGAPDEVRGEAPPAVSEAEPESAPDDDPFVRAPSDDSPG
ncbi:MAG: polymer-forming cytoskeletal protein [Sandaracinaceae bacterium]|nr:polymer-forming cytoskeletal protein [Sandaracinaceae bacterium]